MDIRVLRYFLTVAKEQSFTKGAEQLHITQPTLSRQLAALEEELGTPLFIRSGRNITLTDEGILLKRRALEIIDLEERTIDEIRGTEELIDGSSGDIGTNLQKLQRKISSGADCHSYGNSGHDL